MHELLLELKVVHACHERCRHSTCSGRRLGRTIATKERQAAYSGERKCVAANEGACVPALPLFWEVQIGEISSITCCATRR
jgi:hypothetical protein